MAYEAKLIPPSRIVPSGLTSYTVIITGVGIPGETDPFLFAQEINTSVPVGTFQYFSVTATIEGVTTPVTIASPTFFQYTNMISNGDVITLNITVISDNLVEGSYVRITDAGPPPLVTLTPVIVAEQDGAITVEKTIFPSPVEPGGQYTTTVDITNTFGIPISIWLRDTIPPGTEIINTSFTPDLITSEFVDWSFTVGNSVTFQIVSQITDNSLQPFQDTVQVFIDTWFNEIASASASVSLIPIPPLPSDVVIKSVQYGEFGILVSGNETLVITPDTTSDVNLTAAAIDLEDPILEIKSLAKDDASDNKKLLNVKTESKLEYNFKSPKKKKKSIKNDHKVECKSVSKHVSKHVDSKDCKVECKELYLTRNKTTEFCANVLIYNKGLSNSSELVMFKLFLDCGLFNSKNTRLTSDQTSYRSRIIGKESGYTVLEVTIPSLQVGASANFTIKADLLNSKLIKYKCFLTTALVEPDGLSFLETRVKVK